MYQDRTETPFSIQDQVAVTWQELLAEIIEDKQERHRIAYALGIRSHLLVRWVRNEASPHVEQLRQLVELMRPAYHTQMQRLVEDDLHGRHEEKPVLGNEVPSEFYKEIVQKYTTLPATWQGRELQQAVLRQIVHHLSRLDPDEHGIVVLLITCVTPQQGQPVRSLRAISSFGSGLLTYRLWDGFLGAESHSGYVVATGLPAILPCGSSHSDALTTLDFPDDIHSVIAAPLRRGERIAGCLTACSLQPEAFASARLALLQDYADLLAAFRFEKTDFYRLQQIQLGVMPPHTFQRTTIASFQQRVASAIRAATQQSRSMTLQQVETQVWQDLESDLLLHSAPCLA